MSESEQEGGLQGKKEIKNLRKERVKVREGEGRRYDHSTGAVSSV